MKQREIKKYIVTHKMDQLPGNSLKAGSAIECTVDAASENYVRRGYIREIGTAQEDKKDVYSRLRVIKAFLGDSRYRKELKDAVWDAVRIFAYRYTSYEYGRSNQLRWATREGLKVVVIGKRTFPKGVYYDIIDSFGKQSTVPADELVMEVKHD